MDILRQLLYLIADVYIWIIIAAAAFSWLLALGVANPSNAVVLNLSRFLDSLTRPVLNPIRRILPSMGGLDLSPLVAILAILFLQRLLLT